MSGALMPTYDRYPLTLVSGQGVRVRDDAGHEYLDLAGGIAAVPIGHSHPRWVEAVAAQASSLVHVSNLFSTKPQVELAEKLVELAGFGQVFFANSGAEANEAALKIARKWGRARGKSTVVTLKGSFHGRTFATLAATGRPEKQEPFEPLVPGFVHVPPEDFQALNDAVDGDTAAVFLEPLLGEGGVIPLHPGYLAEARALCDRHDALLILDEVQTGVGRTGAWFAFQGAGIRPDVITLAKGLGNGLPIGACIAREDAAFGPGEHASTFGGGPVPCAAALATLAVIEEEGLLGNAMEQGKRLRHGLREALPEGSFRDVRGRGLLIGIELAPPLSARAVVMALLERGVLATEAGLTVVRLTPPLVITAAEVDEAIEHLVAAVGEAA